jgi:hypothetical protein
MSNDWDVEMLIKEAQEAAQKPVAYKSLKPHERTFVRSIVRIAEQSKWQPEDVPMNTNSKISLVVLNGVRSDVSRTNPGTRISANQRFHEMRRGVLLKRPTPKTDSRMKQRE